MYIEEADGNNLQHDDLDVSDECNEHTSSESLPSCTCLQLSLAIASAAVRRHKGEGIEFVECAIACPNLLGCRLDSIWERKQDDTNVEIIQAQEHNDVPRINSYPCDSF